MLDNHISIYKAATDNQGSTISIQDAIQAISSGKYAKQIAALRKAPPEQQAELKKKLPAVTWSGTFGKRSAAGLEQYSGIICIDVDKIKDADLLPTYTTLVNDPFCFFVFISPSGNGIKALIRTSTGADTHKELFLSLEMYFKEKYNITIDKSCKDVSRLCFLSSDRAAQLNENAEIYTPVLHQVPATKPEKRTFKKLPAATDSPAPLTGFELLDKVKTFTDNIETFTEGNRDNYLHQFACNCNRRGIDVNDCLSYVQATFPLTADEYEGAAARMRTTYSRNASEYGKFKNASFDRPAPPLRSSPRTDMPVVDDSIVFWYEVKTKDKDTGEEKKKIIYSFDKMIAFLSNNGFFKYGMENNSFVLIRVHNNIVDVVDDRNIAEFVLDYLENEPVKFEKIRELFRQKIGTYMDMKQLVQLPYLPYQIKKLDTPDTAYVYFRNVYLRIDKDQIQVRQYSELEGHIWSRQRIDFDYVEDTSGCISVVEQFIWFAICGRLSDKENPHPLDELNDEKMLAVLTSIGYLLHSYKDPTVTKAVVATDKQLRDTNESNGGTGKSLLMKILAKFKNTCHIEGKSFKFDAPRPFETLKPDHGIINFNDVRRTFDFEGLYGLLTDDFTYNVIYKQPVTISFDDSPKVYISTNYSLRGEGSSMVRRQQIIEFSNYFTPTHQPQHEFGHTFFYDWHKPEYKNQWSLFYTFMIRCIKIYLKHRLQPFPLENYEINKFIDEAGEHTYDWCENIIKPLINCGKQDKNLLYNGYLNDNPAAAKFLKPNTFTKWIKSYCRLQAISINAHLPAGERDKSNGKEYWTFINK